MALFAPFDPVLKIQKDYSVRVRPHHPEDRGLALLKPFAPLLTRALGVRAIGEICRIVNEDSGNDNIHQKIANAFDLKIQIDNPTRVKIPDGPLIVVANHPLAGLDSVAIAAAISQTRGNVGIYLNSMLAEVPGLQSDEFIFVNVYETARKQKSVITSLRKSHDWLDKGGALVIHPAGAVSDRNNPQKIITDPPWTPGAFKLSQKHQIPILPIFVRGNLSRKFYAVRRVNVNASVAIMIPEMMQLKGSTINLEMRRLVAPPARDISPKEGTDYLRRLLYGSLV